MNLDTLTSAELDAFVRKRASSLGLTVEQYFKYLGYLDTWRELHGSLDTSAHHCCLQRAKHGAPQWARDVARRHGLNESKL